MRYGRPNYTARRILKSPLLSDATIAEIKRTIWHECDLLCKKTQSSHLRVLNIKDLYEFKWEALIEQLQRIAPVLTSVLSAAATRSSTEKKSNMVAICVVAALLLKNQCKHMCKVQMIVSSLLYAGHAAIKVSICVHAWYSLIHLYIIPIGIYTIAQDGIVSILYCYHYSCKKDGY